MRPGPAGGAAPSTRPRKHMTPRRPPSSHPNLDALASQQPATPSGAAVLAGGARDAPGRSSDDRTQRSPQRTAMIAKDLFTPKDFRRIRTKILRDHGAGQVIPPGEAADGRPGPTQADRH